MVDLPDFDATPYLDVEVAIAAYLIDILEANKRSAFSYKNLSPDLAPEVA